MPAPCAAILCRWGSNPIAEVLGWTLVVLQKVAPSGKNSEGSCTELVDIGGAARVDDAFGMIGVWSGTYSTGGLAEWLYWPLVACTLDAAFSWLKCWFPPSSFSATQCSFHSWTLRSSTFLSSSSCLLQCCCSNSYHSRCASVSFLLHRWWQLLVLLPSSSSVPCVWSWWLCQERKAIDLTDDPWSEVTSFSGPPFMWANACGTKILGWGETGQWQFAQDKHGSRIIGSSGIIPSTEWWLLELEVCPKPIPPEDQEGDPSCTSWIICPPGDCMDISWSSLFGRRSRGFGLRDRLASWLVILILLMGGLGGMAGVWG